MANYKPEQATSLSEFISLGEDVKITYNNYSIKKSIDGGVQYPIHNVLYDYINEVKSKAVLVTLNQSEISKYRFKPRLLAYDVYGNSELYFVILAINNIIDIKDFDFKQLYMLKRDDISIINKIYIAESKYLKENNEE